MSSGRECVLCDCVCAERELFYRLVCETLRSTRPCSQRRKVSQPPRRVGSPALRCAAVRPFQQLPSDVDTQCSVSVSLATSWSSNGRYLPGGIVLLPDASATLREAKAIASRCRGCNHRNWSREAGAEAGGPSDDRLRPTDATRQIGVFNQSPANLGTRSGQLLESGLEGVATRSERAQDC